ncbi:peptidoglycan DD-metalloendopeptidase family protein [Actinomadura welshii]
MKRHEARAKRSRQRTEDQFGARNRPSALEAERFEPRARPSASRNRPQADRSDARTQFGVRNDPPDARTKYGAPRSAPRDDRPAAQDARTRFGARDEASDARTRSAAQDPARDARMRPGAPYGTQDPRNDARTRFGSRDQASDARMQPGPGRTDPRAQYGAQDPRNDARMQPGAGPGRTDPRAQYGAQDPRNDARVQPGADTGRTDPRAQYGAQDPRNDARTRFGSRDQASDARMQPGPARTDPRAQNPRNDARVQPGADTGRTDPRAQYGAQDPRNDARAQFGVRDGGSDARTREFAAWGDDEPDARTRDFDARRRPGRRPEGAGAGRDRSREFQPRGGRPPRPARQERPVRAQSRQPAPPARRPATARPGPKATPRRGRRPTDRMSVGAIVLSTAVGLSLLGIAERALLDGGPIGGASGPAGSEQALTPQQPGGNPAGQPQQQAPQQPGQNGAPAEKAAPNLGVLAGQVRELTIDERGAAAQQAYGAPPGGRPIVDLTRTSADKSFVFGTTALPVPTGSSAAPEVAFYAARWTGEEWQVGLSGGKVFNDLLGSAPADVMKAAEAQALRRYGAVTAAQATALVNGSRAGDGLMLPWKSGEAWSMATSEDSARPLGSLAFSGGDGRVLAAGDGRLYRFCSDSAGRAMVVLVHASGIATTYYRMQNVVRVRDGGVVEQGSPLGRTGTDRPCGGAASPRPEVGFGLRHGGGRVPLDGAQIGGWTFRERADPLLGFAERGALQVLPGGLIANLGALPIEDDGEPSSAPSPRPSAGGGAGSTPAPEAGATQNRSQSGANSQQ